MLSGKFAVVKSRSNSNPTFPVVPRVPGVALTLNPRLRALGLSPSAFNLSGWIPSHTIAAIININNTIDTLLCKSVPNSVIIRGK